LFCKDAATSTRHARASNELIYTQSIITDCVSMHANTVTVPRPRAYSGTADQCQERVRELQVSWFRKGPSFHHLLEHNRMATSAEDVKKTKAMLLGIMRKNPTCCDCNGREDVTWASIAYGIVVCLSCSGLHRRLGVHNTFVQSLTLDNWEGKTDNLAKMESGSNLDFHEYINALKSSPETSLLPNGIPLQFGPDHIHELYTSAQVQHYKETLGGGGRESFRTVQRRGDFDGHVPDGSLHQATPGQRTDKKKPAVWSPDHDNTSCFICSVNFTLFTRKHHCRNCGSCICGRCAPKENTKPIPEYGIKTPVRHCKNCYRSPCAIFTD